MGTVKNAIVVAVALATVAVGTEPALVPAPRHMKVGNGVYAVKASNINDIVMQATHDKSLPPEGYRLVVQLVCGGLTSERMRLASQAV